MPGIAKATSQPTDGPTSDVSHGSATRVEYLDSRTDYWRLPREMVLYAIPIAAIFAIWFLAIELFGIKSYVLPRPDQVLITMWTDRTQLLNESWITFQESVWGFLIGVVLAVLIATALTFSPTVSRAIYPILVVAQVVPKVAIGPLFVVWMGFGTAPKILLAFLVSFFALVVNTATGLSSLEPKMIHLAKSMGANTWQVFVRFRLPNSLPIFFAGLKIGVTLAVIGAVVGEFVGAGAGLGHLTVVAMGSLKTELVFASIVFMAAIGIVLYAAIDILERVLVPWQPSKRSESVRG